MLDRFPRRFVPKLIAAFSSVPVQFWQCPDRVAVSFTFYDSRAEKCIWFCHRRLALIYSRTRFLRMSLNTTRKRRSLYIKIVPACCGCEDIHQKRRWWHFSSCQCDNKVHLIQNVDTYWCYSRRVHDFPVTLRRAAFRVDGDMASVLYARLIYAVHVFRVNETSSAPGRPCLVGARWRWRVGRIRLYSCVHRMATVIVPVTMI